MYLPGSLSSFCIPAIFLGFPVWGPHLSPHIPKLRVPSTGALSGNLGGLLAQALRGLLIQGAQLLNPKRKIQVDTSLKHCRPKFVIAAGRSRMVPTGSAGSLPPASPQSPKILGPFRRPELRGSTRYLYVEACKLRQTARGVSIMSSSTFLESQWPIIWVYFQCMRGDFGV